MRCYRIVFPPGVWDEIKSLEINPLPEPDNTKLQRFRGEVPETFPQLGSFTFPLFTYYSAIHAIGQPNVARALLGALHVIAKKTSVFASNLLTDAVRKCLKTLSSESFQSVFSDSPAYMFFMHLHSLGGRAPYTKSQIISDIESWVSEKPDLPQSAFIDEWLPRIFTKFKRRKASSSLTFKDFCDDPMLWATSGGAKKSEINNTTYRNKWAWALSKKTTASGDWTNVDLYQAALSEDRTAQVALKEEPTKTREVITTPMASYLRQSYLAYRWGKLKINSPMGSKSFLPVFQMKQWKYYLALDGDRFDQTIPASFVKRVIRELAAIDSDTAFVVEQELEDLENLWIRFGTKRWKWKGGVLSGWRLTSLITSLASLLAGYYIIIQLGMQGVADVGVLGDDIVIFSMHEIDRLRAHQLYEEFGFKANLFKTSAGAVGEFLRKTYSPLGVLAYPALGARSLFFASPWIASYQPSKYVELATNWMTFLSRMLPHRTIPAYEWFLKLAELDLTRAFGPNSLYKRFLRTPICIGGGGCIETSDLHKFAISKVEKHDSSVTKQQKFLSAFGVRPASALREIVSLKTLPVLDIAKISEHLTRTTTPTLLTLPTDMKITQPLFEWFTKDTIPATRIEHMLSLSLPHSLRNAGKEAILRTLLSASSPPSGLCSIQTTPEVASFISRTSKNIALSHYYKGKATPYSDIDLRIFSFNVINFSAKRAPYGTW